MTNELDTLMSQAYVLYSTFNDDSATLLNVANLILKVIDHFQSFRPVSAVLKESIDGVQTIIATLDQYFGYAFQFLKNTEVTITELTSSDGSGHLLSMVTNVLGDVGLGGLITDVVHLQQQASATLDLVDVVDIDVGLVALLRQLHSVSSDAAAVTAIDWSAPATLLNAVKAFLDAVVAQQAAIVAANGVVTTPAGLCPGLQAAVAGGGPAFAAGPIVLSSALAAPDALAAATAEVVAVFTSGDTDAQFCIPCALYALTTLSTAATGLNAAAVAVSTLVTGTARVCRGLRVCGHCLWRTVWMGCFVCAWCT